MVHSRRGPSLNNAALAQACMIARSVMARVKAATAVPASWMR